jgi:DNA-binding CsgD family transcriptional regulator
MGFAVFWYHLLCFVLFTAAWVMNLLAIPGTRRPWTVPALLIRSFLLLWLLNYTAFYFYFAFFPSTPQAVYDAMTIVSLLASTGLIVSLLLFIVSLFRAVRLRDAAVSAGLGIAVAAGGVASIMSKAAAAVFVFQNAYYALLAACALYGAAAVSRRFPFLPRPAAVGTIPRFHRKTLGLLALFFPLIWLDHVYINVSIGTWAAGQPQAKAQAAELSGAAGAAADSIPIEGAAVTEGILVTGILLILLAVRDIRRVRGLFTELTRAGSRGISEGFAREYSLTGREVEVGSLLAEGLPSREIAEKLCISRKTVEAHIYNLYRKTRVSNRTSFLGLLRDASY